jgi:hypothetical protein
MFIKTSQLARRQKKKGYGVACSSFDGRILQRLKLDDGGPPTAGIIGQVEGTHIGELTQYCVYCLAQGSCSFAMNDADQQDAPGAGLLQIIRHKIANITWMKRVQVEGSVYWEFNGLGLFGEFSHAISTFMALTTYGFSELQFDIIYGSSCTNARYEHTLTLEKA